jgi:transcriptional regulator with XRE-family HTH domain
MKSPTPLAAMPIRESKPPRVRRTAQQRQPHYMRAWRQSYGLTLAQMAEAITRLRGRMGATKPTLSRIENGEREYRQDILEAYAEIIGCTPGDLLSRAPTDPDGVWQALRKPRAPRQR